MSEHDIDGGHPAAVRWVDDLSRDSVVRALTQDGLSDKGGNHLVRFSPTAPQ